MKILFSSYGFPPGIGGIEEVGGILAHQFSRRGHEVIVVTHSMGQGDFPFVVKRRPRPWELAGLTRWCEVVFHNNISLQTAWPLALIRRPWVVAHHTWIARTGGRIAAVDHLKLRAIRAAANIAVSKAIAAKLGVEASVIPNPYRDDVFTRTNFGPRERDVVFVGRLVSDKGVDLMLDALALLNGRLKATVVGDGPERQALEARARTLGIDVAFTGVKRGRELAALLNAHGLLAVPSRWEEPFGVVALEAMACGCVPVVARAGGLPEAVGDAGIIFEKGNARALADCLLADESRLEHLRQRAPAHLEGHRAVVIAGEYLDVLEGAVR